MARGVDGQLLTHEEIVREQEVEQLRTIFRNARGSYVAICEVLVRRGLLAEMPHDLDKPIWVSS